MTSDLILPDLAETLIDLVKVMIDEIRPRLVESALSGRHAERTNLRHPDNFLSSYDLWAHDRYRQLLTEHIPSYIYASEEADPQIIGDDPDPDLCILVDPLDTSEMAVRALNGYTHVMAYSRSRRRPVAAVVGDIFHHLQIYAAGVDSQDRDQAILQTSDGSRLTLHPNRGANLSTSLITNFFMKPAERLLPLMEQQELIHALSQLDTDGRSKGRIGLDFGSVSLCHVAAGMVDATVEFAKGFAIWDLAPGHYILHAAGGVVLDLAGNQIGLDYGLNNLAAIHKSMSLRQKFVAAPDSDLAHKVINAITL